MREQRIFVAPVEVRAASDEVATIAGYAAVFDSPYDVGGWFTEEVAPGAFKKSLRERKDELAVVSGHDPNKVLGTVASKTARFVEDSIGLNYEADVDLLDPDGLSAYRKIATGKVRQSSFAFEVVKDEWHYPEDPEDRTLPHRILREVKLWEASPVLWGANPGTSVDTKRAVRSLAESVGIDITGDADAFEKALREVGLSAALASRTTSDESATPEPPEPQQHSASTPEPETSRTYFTPGT